LMFAVIRFRAWQGIRAAIRASLPASFNGEVEIRTSLARLEPGVAGWIRPIILLPVGIEKRLTSEQVTAVITHELCHVRRRDNLTAAIHMIAESIFWFHPLIWWIGTRMLEERERACDEAVPAERQRTCTLRRMSPCRLQVVRRVAACLLGRRGGTEHSESH
jgi:bla regulator protein blaR1